MRIKLFVLLLCAFTHPSIKAQGSFDEFKKRVDGEFNQMKQKTENEYQEFRNRINSEYADFLRKTWEEFNAFSAIPMPKEDEKPPVVIPKEEKEKTVEDKPVPIKEKIITPPIPKPQPEPVAPIKEKPAPSDKYVPFTVYGTSLKVRFNDSQRFKLNTCNSNSIADIWERLSTPAYNNTIFDCLELRKKLQLSDWAYLNILDIMSKACLGETNEATILMAYIYCQSGYKMRLATSEQKVIMLYSSVHTIFNKCYFQIEGDQFYAFNSNEQSLNICDAGFPQEKSLSLLVPYDQLFAYSETKTRTLKSERYPSLCVNISANKNSISFYNNYPTSMTGEDIMTRWAMYANTPMPKGIREKLYPALRSELQGLNQKEAMERLLNFTQTAFVYEYDDKVWGGDRAFFPEETLYYPYCDCEDRSIFLSRLVRDLLGLDCILIYYPGHLAMAVHFTQDVRGDYILLNSNRYIVCDPTYIGAPVGRTMPQMDNSTAQVILLK